MQNDIVALFAARGDRLAFGVAVIAVMIKLLKDDNAFPLSIPAKWKWLKPWLAIALGMAGAVLEHVMNGTPWKAAIVMGIVAGIAPIAGHELLKGKPAEGSK